MLDDIARAVALMLVFEGIMPFVAPNRWRNMALVLSQLSEAQMRLAGLASMFGGLVILLLWR
jgi:uncharacterized protein YjeT (DUF2065 family)